MFSSFMVNTWIVASIVAATAGLVGFFVVVRGSSFAAHALPLSTFPGAAAAAWLGINEIAGLVIFALLGVIGIDALSRRGRPEVATALTLVLLLGLGTLFLSQTAEYSQEVYGLLFGQILGIGARDIAPIAVVCALAAGAIVLLFRPLLLGSVSRELAQARGAAPGRLDLAFLIILAMASAVALPVVGALLVFSLMVGPASAARNLTDRPGLALGLSVMLSLIIGWAAIALSYVTNWPVGFFVGGFGAVAYALGRSGLRFGVVGSVRA
ncbi:metal ABC transporter permease [Acidiphilium acidophilum]|uniref:Metal ABC transporter permease n=1 Tax=Acidiphilium acidophilum TaxID=76588 RepID=A0AAW9DM28_ACIAO|nr:metal ABC transporter permease [Acidiphilium acidophilum]MDX5930209.1 metal ABC transporter permease [Acidiphilium acidophilum]